jgi:hypothetical protein
LLVASICDSERVVEIDCMIITFIKRLVSVIVNC